jgi:hypothetical protein
MNYYRLKTGQTNMHFHYEKVIESSEGLAATVDFFFDMNIFPSFSYGS